MAKQTEETTQQEVTPATPENSTARAQQVAVPPKKSNKKLFIILGLVLLFLVVIPGIVMTLLFNYFAKEGGEKLIEGIAKSQGVDVDLETKDGGISLKTKDGKEYSAQTNGKTLPADFPKEVLPLVNNNYTNTSKISLGGNTTWGVIVSVKEPASTVCASIKQQLTGSGWIIEADNGEGNYSGLTAKKGEYSVVVACETSGNDTTVNYLLTKSAPAQ